jgi:predicted DNA-binding protein (MmcQ/YjbR family)
LGFYFFFEDEIILLVPKHMNIEELRDYCLRKKHATEEFPFDEKTLVFKVAGKIFALTGLETYPPSINLKCSPAYALELREAYPCVQPGYHSNKKHWNTIVYENFSEKLLKNLIDHSYDKVVEGMSRKMRLALHL